MTVFVLFTLMPEIAMAETPVEETTIELAKGAHGKTQRIAGNVDSWVALAILFVSLLTPWALNFTAPKVRACGSFLAASGCLAVAFWFLFFIQGTGFLESPKPNQTPLDSAKPMLLWIQSGIALFAGIYLLTVANRQKNETQPLNLAIKNQAQHYGWVARMLHWSIAILFLSLIPMGIFASIIPEDTPYRNAYYVVHKTLGVIVLALVIARIIWHRISPPPALEPSLKPTEKKAAHLVHKTLYFMMLAMPVTGFLMTSYHGYPTFFFAWELAPLWQASDSATILWGSMHKYLLPYLLYIVLGAHILGALKHHFIDKHKEAIRRIVS